MNISLFEQKVRDTWTDLPHAILGEKSETTALVTGVARLNLTVMHMATTHVGLMISQAVSCLEGDECYVNVGTWKGYSFFSGFMNNPQAHCIGNDNFSLYTKDRSMSKTEPDPQGRFFGDTEADFYREFNRLKHLNQIFVKKDWLDFFSEFPQITDKKIGFYFYDGDHSFAAQYQALT